jgi:hypothetical protein
VADSIPSVTPQRPNDTDVKADNAKPVAVRATHLPPLSFWRYALAVEPANVGSVT